MQKMGAELTAVFDSSWVHGDESRLEKLQEMLLEDEYKKQHKGIEKIKK